MSNGSTVNTAMIALARESRGWTQKNLADAISASQARICKYELGTQEVSDDDALAIANALKYDVSLLYQIDPILGIGSSLIFHRRRVRVPIKVQTRIQAEMNIRRMQIVRLLRGAAVEHEHHFPSIPPEEFNGNVERVARHVRQLWNVPEGPIPDLTATIERAGGIVLLVDFGTRLIDGVHLWATGLPPIFMMNSGSPGERHRFSLAHEIGHAIMHHASSLNEVEDEANGFASELLLPRSRIRSDLRDLNLEAAARLKQIWKVSMQALIMRAGQLNQISESTRRRLFMHLGARGYRTNEPWPMPMEQPNVFDELIEFHRNVIGLTTEEMKRLLFADELGPLERPKGVKPRLRLVEDDPSP